MVSGIADFFLNIKDFLIGSVSGLLNGPYSWFSWVFPLALLGGVAAGLATGSAALTLGLAAGVPLVAAALGGVVGLLTGGVSEAIDGQRERSKNREDDRKAEAAEKQVNASTPPLPVIPPMVAQEVPTTEITAPSLPQRLVPPAPVPGRG